MTQDFPTTDITAEQAIQRVVHFLQASAASGAVDSSTRVKSELDIALCRAIEHVTSRVNCYISNPSEKVVTEAIQNALQPIKAEWNAGSLDPSLYLFVLTRVALLKDLMQLGDKLGFKVRK